jgi:diacylglycerol kinase (ATP)
MRVALLHNASAGEANHLEPELSDLIRRAGHEVASVVTGLKDLTERLQESPCDLVVVAGGDGTVGKVACELAGWQVPVSILPLGTANNTAHALGLSGDTKKLIKRWSSAEPLPFDLGVLSDGVLRQRFAEAVGWGVFATVIAESRRHEWRGSVRRKLKRDRKLFRAVTSQAPARHYRVEVDGRDASGDYLLVEVMNLPLLGPQLELSPGSNPSDGLFEVVLFRENERALLNELAAVGTARGRGFRVERGAHIRIEASEGVMHRDGRLTRYVPGPRRFEIEAEPAAISYLR